jgi:uncharacterized protein YpiB (UPF0302 family)
MPVKFTELVRLQNKELVVSYQGVTESGIAFFAYIKCNMQQLKMLRADFKNNIGRSVYDYGDVIFMDFDSDETDHAKAFLQKWCAENGGDLLN